MSVTVKSSYLLSMVEEIAKKEYDGHFTLMKFTTNWRACYGTTTNRSEISHMRSGKTMEEALNNLLENPISVYDMN